MTVQVPSHRLRLPGDQRRVHPLSSERLEDGDSLSTTRRLKGVEIARLLDRWTKDLRMEGCPHLAAALGVFR